MGYSFTLLCLRFFFFNEFRFICLIIMINNYIFYEINRYFSTFICKVKNESCLDSLSTKTTTI